MSSLLVFLPPRQRLRALGRAATAADMARSEAVREYDWLLSADGQGIASQGRSPAAQLPAADTVIAVTAESDVSWRRVELPKAARQMRAALAGKLEEALLDDPDALHFALEPDAQPGDTAWVAVTSRPWLADQIAQLEAGGVFVDRVAPLATPESPARGHFHEVGGMGSAGVALRWSHAEGVCTLPLAGSLARQLFSPERLHATQWSASPAVAADAERWLGSAVSVQSPGQRALAQIAGGWNLRQFDLAPKARGVRALRQFSREFMRRQWRPVRWGLVLILLVELLGQNLRAWRLNQQIADRKQAIEATLTGTFPQVRAILDAPVQMQKQLDLLRLSAGSVGDQDLETLLAAAATAWPADRPPADALAFEPGRLTLSAPRWSAPQIDTLRSQLRSEGWQLDSSDGKLTLSRATATTTPPGGRP